MKLSITFGDLDHREVVALSQFYDNMKKGGAPISDEEWNSEADMPSQSHASSPTITPTPALDQANEIDSVGVPFNPMVHSEKKAKKDNGEWRMKRGADKDAFQAWRDQHARGAAPKLAAQTPAAPPTAPQMNQPAVPNVPVPQEPIQAPDYATWHQTFTQLWNSGRLNADIITQMNTQASVSDATQYAHNEQARGISYIFMQQLLAQPIASAA